MRWTRRRRGGRLQSLGQDFTAGHRAYVQHIGSQGRLWLRMKPFSSPPSYELSECLHTFAHIVERLGLDARDQVLDVGCGPGWLSEFLAQCGYAVTGIDVSEDMVEIARQRIESIPAAIREEVGIVAEFHAIPAREIPWREQFDAAVLYDAMHHLDDELETLRVIRRALVPGGRIFIHEGVRPAVGSKGEQELIAEMEEYGTLEAPFDPEYLQSVLEKAGFVEVTRLVAVDDLVEIGAAGAELERIATQLKAPDMNTMIALNPIQGGTDAKESFAAEIETEGGWQLDKDAGELTLSVTVRNVGRRFWPAGLGGALRHGIVTLGPYLEDRVGGRRELPRQHLPRSLSPGESVDVEVRLSRARLEGVETIRIELVHEGIAWFSEYGSLPLVIGLPPN